MNREIPKKIASLELFGKMIAQGHACAHVLSQDGSKETFYIMELLDYHLPTIRERVNQYDEKKKAQEKKIEELEKELKSLIEKYEIELQGFCISPYWWNHFGRIEREDPKEDFMPKNFKSCVAALEYAVANKRRHDDLLEVDDVVYEGLRLELSPYGHRRHLTIMGILMVLLTVILNFDKIMNVVEENSYAQAYPEQRGIEIMKKKIDELLLAKG